MKKWENPNIIALGVEATEKKGESLLCFECKHAITPGKPDNSNHKGWCSALGGGTGGDGDVAS